LTEARPKQPLRQAARRPKAFGLFFQLGAAAAHPMSEAANAQQTAAEAMRGTWEK
jgi:hypothetical protein